MKRKKFVVILIVLITLLSFTGCGKKCSFGCGESADPKCAAEMCDDCCDYWMGLNGCRVDH